MTSNNTTPAKQTTHNHRWQSFIEFTLSRESGSAHLATDLVVGAVQTLNWPTAHLEPLKLALARAIQNVLEGSHLNDADTALIIRVFVSENGEAAQEAGWTGAEPRHDQPSAEAVQQVRWSPSRGWSFFLVQKKVTPSGLTTGSHHLIELFLYQERKHSRKYK
jgi:hypothetical protein